MDPRPQSFLAVFISRRPLVLAFVQPFHRRTTIDGDTLRDHRQQTLVILRKLAVGRRQRDGRPTEFRQVLHEFQCSVHSHRARRGQEICDQ